VNWLLLTTVNSQEASVETQSLDPAGWDVKPTTDAFETRANVIKAIQGHILAKAVYGGLFRRPQ